MKLTEDEIDAIFNQIRHSIGENGLLFVANFKTLNKAKADPEIKYFVIDISTNGGGSIDMLAAMIAFLTGDNKANVIYKNMLTGQMITDTYEVDINLDGKFDEQDKGQACDFHVAIVTSSASFSCGNAARPADLPFSADQTLRPESE